MEIQQLAEISEKICTDLQTLLPADIRALEAILLKDSIKYGTIRSFTLEDSQAIVLLTMKQNCLILIKHLLENEISLPDSLMNAVCSLVNLKSRYLTTQFDQPSIGEPEQRKPMDLHAHIEKEKVIDNIMNLMVDILFISKYKSVALKDYLRSMKVPDDFSVNLTVAIDEELDLESFELTVLSKKLLGPVFLSLVKSYAGSMRRLTKKRIIEMASKAIDTKDRNIVFEIFYHLNEDPHRSILINTKPEGTPEYFGFVSSLVVENASADIAYDKLEPYFDDLFDALQTLLSFPQNEERSVQPGDEKMLQHLLECINSIVKFKPQCFYRFTPLFQGMLKIKIGRMIKGAVYEILSRFVNERDLYISRIVDCRDDVEREIKRKDFYLLPRLIRFLNSYQKREEREMELLNAGVLSGSPYINSHDGKRTLHEVSEKQDFRTLGLKSEDPTTVIECLDCFINPDVLRMYSQHIRNAMIKDTAVIDRMIGFQIDFKVAIDDISIINSILSHSSPRFFEYARLFKDFSFYLNGDVLERISEDPESGTEWIRQFYNKEFGQFVVNNSGFFNELLKANSSIQHDLVAIYDKVLDENLGDVEIRVFDDNSEAAGALPVLCLLDSQEMLSETFFRIFSKQLIHLKFLKQTNFTLLKKYVSPFYNCYVKAKAVCGLDISADILFLKKNLLADDDFLGYLKITGLYTPEGEIHSPSILLNFGVKDNTIFLKNFADASDLEKFILFFNIEYVTKEIDLIVREEIMENLRNPNRVYLRMCILQLFRTKELDQIIRILEKNYEDRELLFKLCVHNVLNGGRYFSKDLFQYGDEATKNKALFILYYLNIWDREYLREMIDKVGANASEDMKYLIDDTSRY